LIMKTIKKITKKTNKPICSDYWEKNKIIKIEISAICNARCIWCWMYNSNRVKQGLMSFDNFRKIINLNDDFLRNDHWLIEPFFNGEALMNPQLFDILDYLVSRRIELSPRFDTNLSVKVDIDRLMSYPWKEIWVNIGGTTKEIHEQVMKKTNFGLVIANLRKMLSINRDIVCIKMNPTKKNLHQLDGLKSFFAKIGGKEENVIPYTTSFPLPGVASREEIKYFFDNVVSEDLRPHLRFEYDLTKDKFGIKAKRPGCNFLVPSIAFDGRVAICCHDQIGKFNMGNAFITPLKKIFNSKKFKNTIIKAANMEFAFCRECN